MPTCLDARAARAAYREAMTSRRLAALGITLLAALALTACAGTPDTIGTSASAPASPAAPTPAMTLAPFPMGPATSTTPLPSNLPQGCRDILTASVLQELDGVPLNAEGMGGGIRSDSTRVCVWGEPGAVGTRLVTLIGYAPDQPARDALYALGNDGYTCYEPHGGIRCEKTWQSPTLAVEEGRTLFYRDGVIVDTQYSNLAPAGYTDAVIDALWPPAGSPPRTSAPTPSPTPTR